MRRLLTLIQMYKVYYQTKKKKPEWYWHWDLNGAKILSVAKEENKENGYFNNMRIDVDTRDALNPGITSVTFYDCKLIEGNLDIKEYVWIFDFLLAKRKENTISITLQDHTGEERELCLSFKRTQIEHTESYDKTDLEKEKSFDAIGEIKYLFSIFLRWHLDTKKIPDWYWRYGLHDAQILEINEYVENKEQREIKCLEIKLDTEQTYSSDMSAVIFESYKVLKGDVNIKGCWWIEDKYKKFRGGYLVIIKTIDENNQHSEVEIMFENARKIVKNNSLS